MACACYHYTMLVAIPTYSLGQGSPTPIQPACGCSNKDRPAYSIPSATGAKWSAHKEMTLQRTPNVQTKMPERMR